MQNIPFMVIKMTCIWKQHAYDASASFVQNESNSWDWAFLEPGVGKKSMKTNKQKKKTKKKKKKKKKNRGGIRILDSPFGSPTDYLLS